MFKKISALFASFLLSFASLFVIIPTVHAAADTCTWTGGGSDDLFSTAANWSGCDNGTVPESGDALVFDTTSFVLAETVNNDLVSASFTSITFQGSASITFLVDGNSFTVTGGITNSTDSSQIINADLVISGSQAINTGALIILNGDLSGSGNITKSGSETLELAGENSSYSGAITVSAGTLWAGNVNALGSAVGGTTIADGGSVLYYFDTSPGASATIAEPFTLAGDGDGFIFTNYSLGVQSPDATSFTFSGAVTLSANTFVNPDYEMKFTGALSGSYTIGVAEEKTGSLVINSSSNNSQTANGTYTAPETTYTLAANSPGTPVSVYYKQTVTVTGTYGTANVASGGTLKGTGTVGALTLGDGAKVAPGLSPGCLNTGNLTFVSGSTYDFEVGGATECTEYDQIKVTGTVTLGNGTLNLIRFNNFAPVAGQTYTIISNDAADAVTGTFASLAEGATFTVDGYVLRVSYVGGDGNDVVLTVVSVPAVPDTGFALLTANPVITLITTTLLAGGIALLARRYNKILFR